MTDYSKHRVRVRDDGAGLELISPEGKLLLFTQSVSVSALIDIVARDKR